MLMGQTETSQPKKFETVLLILFDIPLVKRHFRTCGLLEPADRR
jgi:hypothetical protein